MAYILRGRVTAEGAWERWILYMLDAVQNTAKWTIEKIIAIMNLIEDTKRYVRAALRIVYSHELIEMLFTQAYYRVTDLVEQGIASRNTASKHLKALHAKGILDQRKEGGKVLYVNTKFFDLLIKNNHEFERYPALVQADQVIAA